MMEVGKQTNQFFDLYTEFNGQKKYKLKSLEQYSREHNSQEQPGKQYFKATTLPDIIQQAPMPPFKSGTRQSHEVEKGKCFSTAIRAHLTSLAEMNNRAAFIDFCQGLLNLDPMARWSPQRAR